MNLSRILEKNNKIIQTSIDSYYNFFDDFLGNSSILIGLISLMMLSTVIIISPHTSADFSDSLKTNVLSSEISNKIPIISELDLNSGYININGVKYIIKLELVSPVSTTNTTTF